MSVTIEVFGPETAIDFADEIADDFIEPAKAAVKDARDIVFDEMVRLLSIRTTGESVEDEPPVQRTADLVQSLRKGRVGVSKRGRAVTASITSKDPGGYRLEFGFVDKRGIRTLPHPWIRPAFENTEARVTKRLSQLGEARRRRGSR